MRSRDYFFSNHWSKVKRDISTVQDKGKAVVAMSNNRVVVICPYSPDFVVAANALGGRWRSRTKRWTFEAAQKAAVVSAVCKVYGKSNVIIS